MNVRYIWKDDTLHEEETAKRVWYRKMTCASQRGDSKNNVVLHGKMTPLHEEATVKRV